jgi:uncharacterized protein
MHKILTGPLAVEQVTVDIADWPSAWEGLTLVQLSDFHFDGLRLSPWLLEEIVAACRLIQPDLVLLTGDFVSHDPAPIHGLIPWLLQLPSRYGTYAVLGNHDNYSSRTRTEVTAALERAGIPVLWNRVETVPDLGLTLVGLADFWSPDFDPAAVMNTLSPAQPRLVLSHNPDTAEYLQAWRVDLQLSGHTHGGQIVIPGIGPLGQILAAVYRALPKAIARWIPIIGIFHRTLKHWEWGAGLHTVGQNQLYVNRGLGTYLPGRFFCPPELTVLRLCRKSY